MYEEFLKKNREENFVEFCFESLWEFPDESLDEFKELP